LVVLIFNEEVMKYFQTDDRDDYFDSLDKRKRKRLISVSLVDKNGNLIFKEVKTHVLRKYYKDTYLKTGNGKHIWREGLLKEGYNIINHKSE